MNRTSKRSKRGQWTRRPALMLGSLGVVWLAATLAASVVLDALPLRFPYAADLAADFGKGTGPVVVALGSSRTEGSFEVNRMTAYLAESFPERRPVAFNASVPASGLFTQEAVLNALLDTGRKPDLALVEVNPEFVDYRNVWVKLSRDLTWGNALELGTDTLQKAGARLLENRLFPVFSRRFEVRLAAWRWAYGRAGLPAPKLDPQQPDVPTLWSGYTAETPAPTPMTEELRKLQAWAAPPPLKKFSPTGSASRALTRILQTCQERDVPVIMVDAPVCSRSRAAFEPAEEQYSAFIASLLDRFPQARYHDARGVLPDLAFGDHHHVNRYGQHLMCRHLAQTTLPQAYASWGRGGSASSGVAQAAPGPTVK